MTLIPFAEWVLATELEAAHFEIRILRLKQREVSTGRSATFISVSGKPEVIAELRDPKGNWEKIPVKRLMITEAPIKYPQGSVPVKVNAKSVPTIPVVDEGNYVVVIYDDAEGNIHSVNFRDFKYLTAD